MISCFHFAFSFISHTTAVRRISIVNLGDLAIGIRDCTRSSSMYTLSNSRKYMDWNTARARINVCGNVRVRLIPYCICFYNNQLRVHLTVFNFMCSMFPRIPSTRWASLQASIGAGRSTPQQNTFAPYSGSIPTSFVGAISSFIVTCHTRIQQVQQAL